MKRSISLFLILLLLFLTSSCRSAPEDFVELETRVVDVADAQSVLIQIDHGELIILRSDDSKLSIAGRSLFADELEYVTESTEEQILIKVFVHRDRLSNVPLQVEIRLPQQVQAKVETENASVFAKGLQGSLEVASTAGDITVEQMTGDLTLRSNRGNIKVRESTGKISMVGNYGLLSAEDVHDDTSISTIMGNILFNGLIDQGDSVRLETDHGSVSVNLHVDSALTLQARSTSGDVTCMLPDVLSSTRTCDGTLHAGGGDLSIRTVSGAVTLQLLP
jgi:DUF4097 and DUF4098 domain-containing protein YvlB